MKLITLLQSATFVVFAAGASAACTLDDQFNKAQEFTQALQTFVQSDPSKGAELALRQSKLIQEATASGDADAICAAYDTLIAEIDIPEDTTLEQANASCDDAAVQEHATTFMTSLQTLATTNKDKAQALLEQSQIDISTASASNDVAAVCVAYDNLIAQANE